MDAPCSLSCFDLPTPLAARTSQARHAVKVERPTGRTTLPSKARGTTLPAQRASTYSLTNNLLAVLLYIDDVKEVEAELKTDEVAELWKAILLLRNPQECEKFFRDLLTLKEIREAARRWKVTRMLAEVKRFTEIQQATGMSSVTISRINYWLHHGTGGYRLVLERIGRSGKTRRK